MIDLRAAITQAHHQEWARVVASLARRFGDLDIAEEAAAEAFATAVERWPADGVPPNPGAWLTTTANRKAIDRIRRENKRHDGRMGNSERVAKLHTAPCAAWGSKARMPASTWEIPVIAQLGSIRIDTVMRAQITAVLSASERPVTMDRARLERQMRELALEPPRLASTTRNTSCEWHASAEIWKSWGRSRPGTCQRVARPSGSTPWPKRGIRPI